LRDGVIARQCAADGRVPAMLDCERAAAGTLLSPYAGDGHPDAGLRPRVTFGTTIA
jgi:hypothetical protein